MTTHADIATERETAGRGETILRGRIAATARVPIPAAVDDLVAVAVRNPAGGEQIYGPMVWPARGAVLPVDGDLAVIARAHDGLWVVVVWWPQTYTQP